MPAHPAGPSTPQPQNLTASNPPTNNDDKHIDLPDRFALRVHELITLVETEPRHGPRRYIAAGLFDVVYFPNSALRAPPHLLCAQRDIRDNWEILPVSQTAEEQIRALLYLREYPPNQWGFIVVRDLLTDTPTPRADSAHSGDPCRFCGSAHDDVPAGPCAARIKLPIRLRDFTDEERAHMSQFRERMTKLAKDYARQWEERCFRQICEYHAARTAEKNDSKG